MVDMLSDTQDLIDRAARGDEAARHRLLERYRDYLRRMVAVRLDRRLAPRIDASDIVQEALVEADRRLDGYLRERPIPFYAWLRQIAGDRIVDAHRLHVASQKRSVTREDAGCDPPDESSFALARFLLADDTSPSNRLIRQEDQEEIRRAIDALPPKDREVLVMRHLEQLGTAEIAATLGVAEGAVKVRLLRALVRLRERLGAEP
jgi:RNA polymerase sigma-70 factor (ECF subfamily)